MSLSGLRVWERNLCEEGLPCGGALICAVTFSLKSNQQIHLKKRTISMDDSDVGLLQG